MNQIIADKEDELGKIRMIQTNTETILENNSKVLSFYRDRIDYLQKELTEARGGVCEPNDNHQDLEIEGVIEQHLKQHGQLHILNYKRTESQIKQIQKIKQGTREEDDDEEDEDEVDQYRKLEEVAHIIIRENKRLLLEVKKLRNNNNTIYKTFQWSSTILNDLLKELDKQRGVSLELVRKLELNNAQMVKLQGENYSLKHGGVLTNSNEDVSLSKMKQKDSSDLNEVRRRLDALWIAHTQKYDISSKECAQKEQQKRTKELEQIRHQLATWKSMGPEDVKEMKSVLDRREFEDFVHEFVKKASYDAIFRLDPEVKKTKV